MRTGASFPQGKPFLRRTGLVLLGAEPSPGGRCPEGADEGTAPIVFARVSNRGLASLLLSGEPSPGGRCLEGADEGTAPIVSDKICNREMILFYEPLSTP